MPLGKGQPDHFGQLGMLGCLSLGKPLDGRIASKFCNLLLLLERKANLVGHFGQRDSMTIFRQVFALMKTHFCFNITTSLVYITSAASPIKKLTSPTPSNLAPQPFSSGPCTLASPSLCCTAPGFLFFGAPPAGT